MKGYSYRLSDKEEDIHKLESSILRKMIRKDPKNRKNSYEIMKS